MNALLEAPELRGQVRNIAFRTLRDPNAEGSQYMGVFTEEWRTAAIGIWKLSNLSSLQLGFGPANTDCCFYYEAPFDRRAIEKLRSIQHQFMKLVFETLCSRNDPKPCLRSLSIKNLPDFHDRSFTASPIFNNLLSRLSKLHLHMLALSVWDDPRLQISRLSRFFSTDIARVWLKPSLKSLTHLTLCNDIFWGYLPAFDCRDLRFPKLKHLVMNNYTFAHDWQIEWIIAHGPTLETLILDECPILFYMLTTHSWSFMAFTSHEDHENPLRAFGNSQFRDDRPHWAYNRRWHHVFTMLQEGLSFLTKFGWWRDGSGLDNEAITFEARDVTLPRVLQNYYVIYDGRWEEPLHAPKVFEGILGSHKIRVQSPTVAEPPYELIPRKAEQIDEPEISESKNNESEDYKGDEDKWRLDGKCKEESYDDSTGCQKDDEEAFLSFIETVTNRARSQGL